MTRQEVHDEVVAEDAVETDRELAEAAGVTKRRATDAKKRHGEAIAALNQWRWEMTVCPFGPRYTVEEYAEAVGQHHSTISGGARSWQAHLDKRASDSADGSQNHSGCTLGGEPHDGRERPAPLTDEEVESHDEARRKLDAGAVKAIIIERLAAYWGVVPTTMEVNYRALVNDAVARLNAAHDPKTMDAKQVTKAVDDIAAEMWQEAKLRDAREKAVQKWMTRNREAEQPVPMGEARKMVDRIERRMASREWTWEQAEADQREWDWKRCEVERDDNVLRKRARIAVLDLMQSAARIKSAAIKVGKAVQAIEEGDIPMTDEERTLVRGDLTDAAFIIAQAQAATGGETGIDWNKALTTMGERQ
jgi:hypothetical protein